MFVHVGIIGLIRHIQAWTGCNRNTRATPPQLLQSCKNRVWDLKVTGKQKPIKLIGIDRAAPFAFVIKYNAVDSINV